MPSITYPDKSKFDPEGTPDRQWRDVDANEVKLVVNAKQDDSTNLTAIAAISTNGYLKRTGPGSWAVDAGPWPSLAGFIDFAGNRLGNLTDPVGAQDADTKAARDAAIATALAAIDAFVFKGGIDASTEPDYPAADAGWTYKFTADGKIGGAAGIAVKSGDSIICTEDGTPSGDQATVGDKWIIIRSNLDGVVIGPNVAVDERIAVFDLTTGKLIKDGGMTIADVLGYADAGDAFVQQYAEQITSYVPVKQAMDCATTSALPAYTAFVGTTTQLFADVNGYFPSTDSVLNDATHTISRVLVKNEVGANAKYNGTWILLSKGSPSTKWQLGRTLDSQANGTDGHGLEFAEVTIIAGTVNGGKRFRQENVPIVLDTTDILWVDRTPITGGTVPVKATAAELNTGIDDAKFATAFGLEGSKYITQRGGKVYAATSGTNTYTVSLTPAITAYTAGLSLKIKFGNTNTGASTLNVDGLGAISMKKNVSLALEANDLVTGGIYECVYDGTNFQVIGLAATSVPSASESTQGIAEIATQAETNAGTDDARIVTPLKIQVKNGLRATKTANYPIVSGDNQTQITANSASVINITIDQMSTDYWVCVVNIGAGQVNFVAGSGVTLSGISSIPGGTKGGVFIWFSSATTAYIFGSGDVSFTDVINRPTTISGYGISNGVSIIFNTGTTVGNVGTGEDDLHTFSVPAGTMSNDGETLIFESAGRFATSVNNKRVRVRFGATVVFDSASIAVTTQADWAVRVSVYRTGASTQRCIATFTSGSAVLSVTSQYATAAENLSGAITFKVTGEATSNDDVQAFFTKIRKEGYA